MFNATQPHVLLINVVATNALLNISRDSDDESMLGSVKGIVEEKVVLKVLNCIE